MAVICLPVGFVVCRGLRKRYVSRERREFLRSGAKVVEALAGVDLEVERGRLLSLVGPNGAGKTTLVKILATLLLPDGGEAYVGGFDVVGEADKVKRIVGVMLYPDRGFFGRLSGLENLVYYGMLYGLGRREAARRARELLELVGLSEAGDRPYEEYSMGMKARLGLAKALINDPQVLLLDEPTVGLDPVAARRIREAIKAMKREGRTIIFTSHNLYEVEELSDKVSIIVGGRVVAVGAPEELKYKLGFRPRAVVRAVCGGEEVDFVEEGGGAVLTSLLEKAASRGCSLVEARVDAPSLEEVVVKLLGGA